MNLSLSELIAKVRRYVRDTNGNIFNKTDIIDFINEGIYRFQIIPQLEGMNTLTLDGDKVNLLPEKFQYLISVFASARCFEMDERHYQGTQKMNEFETKLEELIGLIEEGKVQIVDGNGNPVLDTNEVDYVIDEYYAEDSDIDNGVVGV